MRRLVRGLRKGADRARLFFEYRVRHRDFLAAYREHTDRRVRGDPAEAIGGRWDEIGKLQFDFLVGRGLARGQRMLDIGCGTLRGGLHFIEHLGPGGYTGIDISPAAIEVAQASVVERGFADREPRLHVTDDLKFGLFEDASFDAVLAQSVFTHLPDEYIDECLAHIGRVLRPDGAFWFTFKVADQARSDGYKEFWQPFSFYEQTAAKHGLDVELMTTEDYPHPRGQRMVRATVPA